MNGGDRKSRIGAGNGFPQAVAVAVQLQNINQMGWPVEKRAAEALRANHLRPFVERKVRCRQCRCALETLRENLEQKFGAGVRRRHEARFINDEQLDASNCLELRRDVGDGRFRAVAQAPGVERDDAGRDQPRRRLGRLLDVLGRRLLIPLAERRGALARNQRAGSSTIRSSSAWIRPFG